MKTSGSNRTRIRTLLVDDSPFMLKVLAQILKGAGDFDIVGAATNGCQGLRYVSLLSPDLVVMDLHMARLNGIQATRCLKQHEHPPVVIIATSDDSPTAKAMAEQAGADAFVCKETNLRDQLLGAVRQLFGSAGFVFRAQFQESHSSCNSHEKHWAKPITNVRSTSLLGVTSF